MRRIMAGLAAAAVAGSVSAQEASGGIALQITFDAETASTLAGIGEWVTVSAYYYGDAAAPEAPQEEDGSVYLGGETFQIFPHDQVVTLGGSLAGMRADWVTEVRINVNIFTARFVAEDNLIDCSFVEGPVAEIAAAENVVNCTLLQF